MQQITIAAKNTTEIELINLLNINEKTIYYIRIWNTEHTKNVVVSIGQKNFENLKETLK